jgi:signal transduction histidine kinase
MKPSSPENLRARLKIAVRRITQDRARRAAEAELARARWLAGIGETTIALEHEINNPLSALLGHAELLLMDDDLTGGQREQLQVIRERAAHIADVVRRLARLKNPKSVEHLAGARMIDLKGTARTD